jgi:NAD(P)H-dependent FMN reductase
MSKLKTAVIIGSTRDARFGPKLAQWIFDVAPEAANRSDQGSFFQLAAA